LDAGAISVLRKNGRRLRGGASAPRGNGVAASVGAPPNGEIPKGSDVAPADPGTPGPPEAGEPRAPGLPAAGEPQSPDAPAGAGTLEPADGQFVRPAAPKLRTKFKSAAHKLLAPGIVLVGFYWGASFLILAYGGITATEHIFPHGLAGRFKLGDAVFLGTVALVLAAVPILSPAWDVRRCWWLAASSIILFGGAWAFFGLNHKSAAVALFLGALVLVAIPLRGPMPIPELTGSHRGALFMVFAFFCGEVVLGLFLTELAVYTRSQPVDLLLALLLGMFVMGVGLSLAMTWVGKRRRLVAPTALGLITLALGALTLQILGPLFKSVTPPNVNGAGLLFISAPPSQPVHLSASLDDRYATFSQGFRQYTGHEGVHLSIATPRGHRLVRWALLLIGDARIGDGPTGDAHFTRSCVMCFEEPRLKTSKYIPHVQWAGHSAPADLFWGTLHGRDSQSISGQPVGSYVSAASSQTAVSLPFYGTGSKDVDGGTLATIRKALGTNPVPRASGDFTVTTTVTPGPTLLNTLTTAVPPLTNPKRFQWQSHSHLLVALETLNHAADDDVHNALFILGVVLGGAAGGLLAGLQRFLEIAQGS
jgi:hypothetical protein